MNRRKFVTNTVISAGGILLGGNLAGCFSQKDQAVTGQTLDLSPENAMKEVLKYRKIDSHAHVYLPYEPEVVIDYADRLGIEKLVVSKPMRPGSKGLPEEFIECNNLVLKAMKMYPDRFLGELTLNPTYRKEALDEIKRCTDLGMVGLKLYNHVKINDPLFYPIIEKFIDLQMPILMHVGIGKARVVFDPGEPENVSIPDYFVDVSKRYPEAIFQLAHLGGGIDWEDACKAIKDCPNVYVDVSGSNNEADIINFAISYLGEDRILFGCDNSFYQGVGHVFSANLTEAQRKKIFFENYNNILRKSGRNIS